MVIPDSSLLIANERKNGNFDPRSMHEFIEGSKEKSRQILEIYQSLERDPDLASRFGEYDDSNEEEREKVAKRIIKMSKYLESEDTEKFWRRLNLVTVYDPSLGIRISVNLGLFLNCVKGNGTESQYNYWAKYKEAGIIKQIYGCFGMTELAHGSNVAGCETTAHFDEVTDEFVINTPHIGATKWWIGGAAHSSTHCSVYARLIVDGKDYGVKTFIVPLRDSNHDLLPGVAVGDIGAKMGRHGVDNGWIQFSNVRIPRFFMLQKWCKVSRDAKVTLPPLEQLSYISLLGGRVYMATDSYRICARFITIATRYGVGRRQFKMDAKDSVECQLMDYPLHQRRLIPYLALTYAMAMGTNKLEAQHGRIVNELEDGIKRNDKKAINKAISETKSLFVDSGSLKSTLTTLAANCIDDTRQACGGHGFSNYNGFGKTYDDWVVQCTWEGDNNVLAMSAGRAVIKDLKNAVEQKPINIKFLDKDFSSNDLILSDLTPKNILDALEFCMVRLGASLLETLHENGWRFDYVSTDSVILSKLRCHHYVLEAFIEQVDSISDPNIGEHLSNILRLYALTSVVEQFSSIFMVYNIMDARTKKLASRKLVPELLGRIRPFVIPLTDSFQQSDNLLHSAIGKYDGDIYENYFKIVKDQNPSNANSKASYSEQFESFLNRPLKDVRNRLERTSEVADILSK